MKGLKAQDLHLALSTFQMELANESWRLEVEVDVEAATIEYDEAEVPSAEAVRDNKS